MPELITADLAPRVRLSLDTSLNEAMLPGELIKDYLWTSGVEAEVKRRDPNWSTYTDPGDEIERLRVACAFLVAAVIAPAVPAIISNQLGDERWQRVPFDAVKRAGELRGLADSAIALNVEPDGLVAPMTQFDVAHGYRGR